MNIRDSKTCRVCPVCGFTGLYFLSINHIETHMPLEEFIKKYPDCAKKCQWCSGTSINSKKLKGTRYHKKGPNAALTTKQAMEVYAICKDRPNLSLTILAKRYNVDPHIISNIKKGKSYKWATACGQMTDYRQSKEHKDLLASFGPIKQKLYSEDNPDIAGAKRYVQTHKDNSVTRSYLRYRFYISLATLEHCPQFFKNQADEKIRQAVIKEYAKRKYVSLAWIMLKYNINSVVARQLKKLSKGIVK